MLISNNCNNHVDAINHMLNSKSDRLIIASPFLVESEAIFDFLGQFDFSFLKKIDFITTFKPHDCEQLTKPFQLKKFVDFFQEFYKNINVTLLVDNNLHGKLYITNEAMIVTSANFTHNGMKKNHEWGVLIKDKQLIEQAMEELYGELDNAELSCHQIKKACLFAEEYKKAIDIPKLYFPDILKKITSDESDRDRELQYFLKPIGHTEKPITLECKEDFSHLLTNLHFAKRPKGVLKGDIVITVAVGASAIISYYRVTGSADQYSIEEQNKEENKKRWSFYMEGKNNSQEFAKKWTTHNLRVQDLVNEFCEYYPDHAITYAGTKTLGSLNYGADKLRITKEFAEFMINKMQECEKND